VLQFPTSDADQRRKIGLRGGRQDSGAAGNEAEAVQTLRIRPSIVRLYLKLIGDMIYIMIQAGIYKFECRGRREGER